MISRSPSHFLGLPASISGSVRGGIFSGMSHAFPTWLWAGRCGGLWHEVSPWIWHEHCSGLWHGVSTWLLDGRVVGSDAEFLVDSEAAIVADCVANFLLHSDAWFVLDCKVDFALRSDGNFLIDYLAEARLSDRLRPVDFLRFAPTFSSKPCNFAFALLFAIVKTYRILTHHRNLPPFIHGLRIKRSNLDWLISVLTSEKSQVLGSDLLPKTCFTRDYMLGPVLKGKTHPPL